MINWYNDVIKGRGFYTLILVILFIGLIVGCLVRDNYHFLDTHLINKVPDYYKSSIVSSDSHISDDFLNDKIDIEMPKIMSLALFENNEKILVENKSNFSELTNIISYRYKTPTTESNTNMFMVDIIQNNKVSSGVLLTQNNKEDMEKIMKNNILSMDERNIQNSNLNVISQLHSKRGVELLYEHLQQVREKTYSERDFDVLPKGVQSAFMPYYINRYLLNRSSKAPDGILPILMNETSPEIIGLSPEIGDFIPVSLHLLEMQDLHDRTPGMETVYYADIDLIKVDKNRHVEKSLKGIKIFINAVTFWRLEDIMNVSYNNAVMDKKQYNEQNNDKFTKQALMEIAKQK